MILVTKCALYLNKLGNYSLVSLFNGISTIVGYIIPKSSLSKESNSK